ncbi:hypothetical protein VA7868_04575 [Vibrio aerogenes CECT 7868]|uniref:EF-hand domain-containing protein n=1 Tax=Vibrio aerogenes CECT 7868 TaxID=1216006 RepID=A0A1M6F415_9VIBR|nr:hypothetical protein [Vibrio aerogenes]SHI92425.1 hypothetical protein VA7868_04575 [Vibrio aerogenes CECT 7868]
MNINTKLILSASLLFCSQFSFAYDDYFDFNGDGVLSIQDIEDLDEAGMLSSERLETLFLNSAPEHMSQIVSPGDFLAEGESREYQGYPVGRINAPVTNDVMNQLWGGKTFYKQSNGAVRLDNRALPLIQNLLDGVSDVASPLPLLGGLLGGVVDGVSDVLSIDAVDADVYNIPSSAMDAQPTVLLDYSSSKAAILSGIRDEIRLIDPATHLYIGRANIEIGYGTLEYAETVGLINTINTLLINGNNCKEEMGGEYVKGESCFALWFFLQPKAED